MLRFRPALIFLVAVIIALLISHAYSGISLWWLLVPILLFQVMIVAGSADIRSGFFIHAHCEGDTAEKEIALTFDDGPHPVFTPLVLDILSKNNVPATFFVIGKHCRANESLLQRMTEEGHTIGNHTWSHSFFIDFKTAKGFRKELNDTADIILSATGRKMLYFRPPYGVTTPGLAKAVNQLGLHIIGWSIRSMDTTKRTSGEIAGSVKAAMRPGAIILFHDTSSKTADVLIETLKFAADNGFKIVSVERLLKIKPYAE